MTWDREQRTGFIKIVLLIAVGVLALSYLGIDLQNNSASPLIKKNFIYLWNVSSAFWNNYLSAPFHYLLGLALKLLMKLKGGG